MKMKKEHIIPLTDTVINILNTMKPHSYNKSIYVFPSPISNLKPISENTLNYALKRLGYGDEIVSHGFRAMFSTVANEFIDDDNAHGVSRDIIEFQLAHKIDNKVGAAYNRALYLKQRTRLIQWWSDYLDGLK
jgi:integrase